MSPIGEPIDFFYGQHRHRLSCPTAPISSAMTETYLNTAYKDREQVKALGAKWDAARKQWYVTSGRDLVPFAAWLPAGDTLNPSARSNSNELTTATTSGGTDLAFVQTGISLSQLLAGVAQAVAQAYKFGIWTKVEVVKADARKGMVYLELAERGSGGTSLAQARGLIWADTANEIVPAFERATGVMLGGGIKLLVRAKPTAHPLYGMSLVIDAIDPDYTLGDLEARKREIRAHLQREGLFDANRKLPQPWDYNAVLVIAPQGAAGLGDFQGEAARLERLGICAFIYKHSRFQGEGAAAEIRRALLEAMDEWRATGSLLPDAVVILRGGGAVNDLAWLNDYDLARCICELEIPVLTGIGHERDNTVLDEVANIRFDTPSKVIAGIEQVTRRRVAEARASFEAVTRLAAAIIQTTRRAVEQASATVRAGASRNLALASENSMRTMSDVRLGALKSVRDASDQSRENFFDVRHQATSQLVEVRLAAPALLAEVRAEARQAVRTARGQSDSNMIAVMERAALGVRHAHTSIDTALRDVAAASRRIVGEAATGSGALMREIAGQGPDKTLGRGFAVVRNAEGTTLTSATGIPSLAAIEIQFHDGKVAARTADQPPNEHL